MFIFRIKEQQPETSKQHQLKQYFFITLVKFTSMITVATLESTKTEQEKHMYMDRTSCTRMKARTPRSRDPTSYRRYVGEGKTLVPFISIVSNPRVVKPREKEHRPKNREEYP